MDKYLKAVKQNVCSICVDSNELGGCTLTSKETCAVELYLPQIVEIVNNSTHDNLQTIHNRLHDTICGHCRNEENGKCFLRDDANCSLDRYFNLIIETIQKASKH
jgi:hypothetical protein